MIATNRVALSLSTLKGEHNVRSLLMKMRIAAQVGFQCVSIRVEDVEAWVKAGRHLRELGHVAADLGIQIVELCEVPLYERGRVADRTREFVYAQALGAPMVAVLHNNSNVSLEQARQDWAKFQEVVGDVERVRPTLHFRGNCRRFNTLDAAWDIVNEDASDGCLLLDMFEFWRGQSSARSLDAVPIDLIGMVHLTDVRNVRREEAQPEDRTFPGRGIMPLTHVVSTLGHRGYTGLFSVEVEGECREQDARRTAEEAYRSARKLLGTSGPSHRKLPTGNMLVKRL